MKQGAAQARRYVGSILAVSSRDVSSPVLCIAVFHIVHKIGDRLQEYLSAMPRTGHGLRRKKFAG